MKCFESSTPLMANGKCCSQHWQAQGCDAEKRLGCMLKTLTFPLADSMYVVASGTAKKFRSKRSRAIGPSTSNQRCVRCWLHIWETARAVECFKPTPVLLSARAM